MYIVFSLRQNSSQLIRQGKRILIGDYKNVIFLDVASGLFWMDIKTDVILETYNVWFIGEYLTMTLTLFVTKLTPNCYRTNANNESD